MGMCQSQQVALSHVQEQLLSNEIPQIDLSEPVAPFILNVPLLLYPQEIPKEEAPKQESPKQVGCLTSLCTYMDNLTRCNLLVLHGWCLDLSLNLYLPTGKW